jgi:hypothetical protein
VSSVSSVAKIISFSLYLFVKKLSVSSVSSVAKIISFFLYLFVKKLSVSSVSSVAKINYLAILLATFSI